GARGVAAAARARAGARGAGGGRLMRAEELAEDHWYRVRVTRPGGLVLGAPARRGDVRLAAGEELTLGWRGGAPRGPARRAGARGWVASAGTFWNAYDAGAALIVYFEDVAVLAEVPDPRRGR